MQTSANWCVCRGAGIKEDGELDTIFLVKVTPFLGKGLELE